MYRTTFVFLAFAFLVLGFSNFSLDKKSAFIMTVESEVPILPEIPYLYAVDQIPDYLTDPSSSSVPYFVSEVNTTAITSVDNDIATLGRVLFYDKKLSHMENISCASCHDQSFSFAENKQVSDGVSTTTKRNAMHLNDLGWSNNQRFNKDMEQTVLKDMILISLVDSNLIHANLFEIGLKLESITYYPELFEKAFGEPYATNERIFTALEQFIISMTTFNSKFDQNEPTDFQNFTESERKGLTIFQVSCSSCHSQGNLSNASSTPLLPSSINNNGLPSDPEDLGAGDWNSDLTDLFKLTTLRNIELTAPYMHDGRFNTLEEVVEHYSSGIVTNEYTAFLLPDGGYGFDDDEKVDLVSFLKTLTDDTFLTNPKWSDPFADCGSSTSDVLQLEDLVLKPNPMADRAVIEFKNDNNQLVSINILSSDGRLIVNDSTTGSQYELTKSSFDSGLYYIELIKGDEKSELKLIVE